MWRERGLDILDGKGKVPGTWDLGKGHVIIARLFRGGGGVCVLEDLEVSEQGGRGYGCG